MASKMRLFQNVQKMHRMMGIYTPSPPQQLFLRLPTSQPSFLSSLLNRKFCLVLISETLLFSSTTAFLLFKATTVTEYGASFSGATVLSSMMIYTIVNRVKMSNIIKLIADFEEFIEERIDKPAMAVYTRLNEKIERISEWAYFVVLFISVGAIGLFGIILSYINYYILDLQADSFIVPTPLMLPYDWQAPRGFLFTAPMLAVTYFAIYLSLVLTAIFYAGSCELMITFIQDITTDLEQLNDGKTSDKNSNKMRADFCKIIQLYSEVKRFIGDFNGIYKFITFTYFLYILLSICCLLLLFLSQLSNGSNPVDIFVTFVQIVYAFLSNFLYCEIGERVTHQFNQFDDEIRRCNWYLFPIEMQRLILISMSASQQPEVIQGYANTVCTRDAFKRTVNGGFSYFMMFQKIYG